MAFSCIGKDDKKIYSFFMSKQEWLDFKSGHNMQLKMPCCGAIAIPKSNKYGCKFFAHKANSCGAGESVEHQYIKYVALKSLLDNHWHVETEKRLTAPSGESFIADVYAEMGDIKIAIEVQCSPITRAELNRRQDKYIKSGVTCFWLCKRRPWCATVKAPIFLVELKNNVAIVKPVIMRESKPEVLEIDVYSFVSKLVNGKIIINDDIPVDCFILD